MRERGDRPERRRGILLIFLRNPVRQYEDSASALPLALVTHGTELGTTVSRSTALIFDLHSGWTLVALAPFLSRCQSVCLHPIS